MNISMTTAAENVLTSFSQLSPEEQLLVGTEIRKRVEEMTDPFADVDFSPIDPEERTHLVRRMFAMYDEEEAQKDQDKQAKAS